MYNVQGNSVLYHNVFVCYDYLSFYEFSGELWNCSDSVVFVCFSFYYQIDTEIMLWTNLFIILVKRCKIVAAESVSILHRSEATPTTPNKLLSIKGCCMLSSMYMEYIYHVLICSPFLGQGTETHDMYLFPPVSIQSEFPFHWLHKGIIFRYTGISLGYIQFFM